ncbi:PEP-CTERM sorting domain-containing protein [Chamaesiphon sp. VAR_48_metabat_403]|uniref:PEP-CTERM sorting domain-containing protein n=1 Tax=Chamaesiphon sp. VAR_48_metabat_403 TaxID=2964700 RepID=UPI00286DC106|nr:PEP-CTERM sorting domain-containing protein [Chamaesiphon sp. VAR_48_metabat_403]
MKKTSLSLLSCNRSIFLSALSLAVAGTAIQAENAQAIDLKFNNPVDATSTSSDYKALDSTFNRFGPGYTRPTLRYSNVATISPGVTIDAQITAIANGTGYTLDAQVPNYTAAGNSNGDATFVYAASQQTNGGLSYKIDLFQGGGTFSTAYVAPDLRFLVYDVDGESTQGEAVRIAKDSGLVGYQVGNTSAALTPTADPDGSYLFSGRDANQPETDSSSATILYFQNVSSVNFQFEAVTRSTSPLPNGVFSAIDGDLSLLGSTQSAIDTAIAAQYSALVVVPDTRASATDVPEPFTIIGTLIGGTAALRMRKKLKADKA